MNTKTETIPFPLRIPSDLKEVLEIKAKRFRRSLNAEIISRLEKGVDIETNGYNNENDRRNKINIKYLVETSATMGAPGSAGDQVDTKKLQLAIEFGEEYILFNKKIFSSHKKALLYGILYSFVNEEKTALSVSNETIGKMLDLAQE